MTELKRFTDSYVKSLKPPPKGQYERIDPAFPNFGIRVSERGSKSWIVYYAYNGVQRRMTLGRYGEGGLSLKDARRAAQKVHGKVVRGENPKAINDERKFPDYVEEYITRYAKPNTRNWRETKRILEREFCRTWKHRTLQSVTKADARVIIDAIVDRGSAGAATRILATVKKFFGWCVERGYLEYSPCDRLPSPRKPVSRDRVLSDGELAALWHAVEMVGYPYQHIMQLLILTGQRKGEVRNLRWSEVQAQTWDGRQIELPTKDFSVINHGTAVWELPAGRTKANRAHIVPLSHIALSVINSVPRLMPEFVFPARGGLDQAWDGFNKAKDKLETLCNIHEHWIVHDLRRTVSTGCAKLGVEPHIIERILNHSTGRISGVAAVYNRHSYVEEMRSALELWADQVGRITGVKLGGSRVYF